MDEVGFLVFAIGSITAMSIGGTALPLWLGGTGRWNAMAIDVLTFFTGGVFLGAGMLHMLPEAAEQAEEAGVTSPLLNPFTCFCVGYLIVYVIEQHTGHQHPALTKEGLLAVAQRARTGAGTASICVVDVPPVTTYHDMTSSSLGLLEHASLLEQQGVTVVPIDGAAGCFDHKAGSYSHGHVHHVLPPLPAPTAHAHGHAHANGASHAHAHAHAHVHGDGHCEGDGDGERCCHGDECSGATPRGVQVHEHAHGHGHGNGHGPNSAPPPPPSLPTSRLATTHGNGWTDEGGCACPSHDHVHPGVRHKHVSVGAAAHTFPLVLALLFSVHSYIAGLALGIQSDNSTSSVAILIAILGHKFVEALSLASSFVREGVGLSTSASVLLVYCCTLRRLDTAAALASGSTTRPPLPQPRARALPLLLGSGLSPFEATRQPSSGPPKAVDLRPNPLTGMTPVGILTGRGVLSIGERAAAAEALISGLAAGSFTFLAAHE